MDMADTVMLCSVCTIFCYSLSIFSHIEFIYLFICYVQNFSNSSIDTSGGGFRFSSKIIVKYIPNIFSYQLFFIVVTRLLFPSFISMCFFYKFLFLSAWFPSDVHTHPYTSTICQIINLYTQHTHQHVYDFIAYTWTRARQYNWYDCAIIVLNTNWFCGDNIDTLYMYDNSVILLYYYSIYTRTCIIIYNNTWKT